jgi:ribosomal protein S18 acetylase RimI-like enzyme
MSGFAGSFQLSGGVALRLARPSDEDFLFQLFIEARPWLSWVEGGRDFVRVLYEQQYKTMRMGQEGAYPEHMDLLIERLGDSVGRVVVNLGYSDWRIAELQIVTAARSMGIGSNVIRGLQAAAARANVSLSLSTPIFGSQAHRLYEQLGFQLAAIDGALYRMVWHPSETHVGSG